jgi:hypothetical protein
MSEVGVSHEWDRAYLSDRLCSAADWFYWLAAFTLGNAIWTYFDVDQSFLFAPGVAVLMNAVVLEIGPGLRGFGLAFGIALASALVFFGWLARRSTGLFILGLALYVLDAALVAIAMLWLHLALHAYVIYKLGNGVDAIRKLRKLPPEPEGATV